MTAPTIGNMARFFVTQKHNAALRDRLGSLTSELSTGRKQDLTRALGSDTARLSEVDRRLSLIGAYRGAAAETEQLLAMTQQLLGRIDNVRGELAGPLVNADLADSPLQREGLARAAREAFADMVGALNARVAGRSAMAGAATDGPALAPAADIIAGIEAAVAGASSTADVEAALEFWFDDPSGGFATMAYLGDTGDPLTRGVDDGVTLTMPARADREEIREVLKAVSMGFAGHAAPALSANDHVALSRAAGVALVGAAEPLVHLQSQVGATEARVAEARTRLETEASALGISRNGMVNVDPFETATALQELQTQLETHYALTARMSRLSLTEYL